MPQSDYFLPIKILRELAALAEDGNVTLAIEDLAEQYEQMPRAKRAEREKILDRLRVMYLVQHAFYCGVMTAQKPGDRRRMEKPNFNKLPFLAA